MVRFDDIHVEKCIMDPCILIYKNQPRLMFQQSLGLHLLVLKNNYDGRCL